MAEQLGLPLPAAGRLERPGLALQLWPGWIGPAAAAALQERLVHELPWRQETIRIFGRSQLTPRLSCWMAEPGCRYRYSGLEQRSVPWHPAVRALIERLEPLAGRRFNAVLLNLYRDGRDAMGWHADDEPELEASAPIASLSLGASRSFRLRARPSPHAPGAPPAGYQPGESLGLELADGDLLLMHPPTQMWWQHALPRRLRVRHPRLNLTFRVVRGR